MKSLPPDTLKVIEADSFWCFSKLLDGIQDNYTFAQPGIQLKVNALKDIVSRVDSEYSVSGRKPGIEIGNISTTVGIGFQN